MITISIRKRWWPWSGYDVWAYGFRNSAHIRQRIAWFADGVAALHFARTEVCKPGEFRYLIGQSCVTYCGSKEAQ